MLYRRKCLGDFFPFVDAWGICTFFSMDYTYESSFLKKGKKVIGVNFKSSG